MIAEILLVTLALTGQPEKEVTDADKLAFFKLLSSLPLIPAGHGPGIYGKESIQKAAPFARVLFALTEKDLRKKEMYPFAMLAECLPAVTESREYAIKNFSRIAHPSVKLHLAHGLFHHKETPPEIVTFLRKALESEGVGEFGYGPYFQAFKESVIRKDEHAKEPKVELVKKHATAKFPAHGGGHEYVATNCVFAPGPLLYSARPLNNDKLQRWQQGELFIHDIAKGTTIRRLIPQPDGFKPKYNFNHYFSSPILHLNARGDLLCRWTLDGNGDHGLALLKKGADFFVVKRVGDFYLDSGSQVVAGPDGDWYLVYWRSGSECSVHRIDEQLNFTQLGKIVNSQIDGGYDARFLTKDVLHLFSGPRCIDFHVQSRKWLHHREIRKQESVWAGRPTALLLRDESLHHLWRLEAGIEATKLNGVYCQPETERDAMKVCAATEYRAVAVGDRIVVCYTENESPTKVFFRVVHFGTVGPVSEIVFGKPREHNLWREYLQIYVEGDRIWFLNTQETESIYELRVVDSKRP